jgi:hypothetical protein
MMFREFSREVANEINAFTQNIQNLSAWAVVTAPLSDEEKLDIGMELINTLGIQSLGAPYALRSRFIFATAHLSHQANRTKLQKGWVDDLPMDTEIFMEEADKYGAGWKRYGRLKLRLEGICGSSFREKTGDFRNAYNHRFSGRLMVGNTGSVQRVVEEGSGKIYYVVRDDPPLQLDDVVKILTGERDRIYAAFAAFQNLVREQEDAIRTFGRASSPAQITLA